MSKDIDAVFTLYRKYCIGTTIVAQNLDQLGSKVYSKNRQTILSNCANKLLFGGATPDDREWWSKEFGNKRKWKYKMIIIQQKVHMIKNMVELNMVGQNTLSQTN